MKKSLRYFSIVLAGIFIATIAFESLSYARAGGGRSSGSRSFRSAPSYDRSYSQQRPYQNQSQRGSFLKSVGGGILGGVLGGMLFRSLGFGGGGGGGILQLIIIAAIGYFIFKFIRNRMNTSRGTPASTRAPLNHGPLFREDSASAGNATPHKDPAFDERSFKDSVMDMFFRIQAAWMNRELSTVSDVLDERMKSYLQDDINKLISGRKINKLENIAVRNVDITESWQEDGYDCITVRIYATILDYTVDETSGAVIEGSRTEPVKFEEFWTFEKGTGGGRWQLAAINQV